MSWKKAKTLHRAFTEVSNFSYYSILWFQLSVNDKMIGWSSWSPAAMQVNGTLAVLSDKERNVELRNRSQLCQGEFSLWIVHVVETVWWLSIYDWCWDQGPQGRWGFRGQLGSVYHAPLLHPGAHQIRCPRTFLSGGPPPPGPEQGFLLSTGEQLLLECWDLIDPFGDQAKPAEADLQSGPASPIHQERRVN